MPPLPLPTEGGMKFLYINNIYLLCKIIEYLQRPLNIPNIAFHHS